MTKPKEYIVLVNPICEELLKIKYPNLKDGDYILGMRIKFVEPVERGAKWNK